jgi:hypothetical protein
LGTRGDIDEQVDITVGASCAADYRPKKRKRCESTLAQRLLERSEFSNDAVLPGRFTSVPRERKSVISRKFDEELRRPEGGLLKPKICPEFVLLLRNSASANVTRRP